MKRTYTLIVLLGLVVGAMLTGCNSDTSTPPKDAGTNSTAAPAAPAASTNK